MSAVSNSVVNSNSKPIQVEVMDVQTCFDKLWLQASLNALHEAGLKNDMLNLLSQESKDAEIAIKVNDRLSTRFNVKNVIMQGSVFGGLKCTSQMDTMNKIMKQKESLLYKYKGDPEITIGVLGMIDDTLGIAECGASSVEKNSVINSFMETHKMKMHGEKSVVIHVGKSSRCEQPCPILKVHEENKHVVKSVKYLGNIISENGSIKETIEDRRKSGWGKVAQILGILGEVDLGAHRVEVGLLLRKAILTSSLLFTAEAWHNVTHQDLKRLEQVDISILRGIMNSYLKSANVFHYLETGSLILRHILTINRLMYHQHLLTRSSNETIKKIYMKQKNDCVKGDWFQLLKKIF